NLLDSTQATIGGYTPDDPTASEYGTIWCLPLATIRTCLFFPDAEYELLGAACLALVPVVQVSAPAPAPMQIQVESGHSHGQCLDQGSSQSPRPPSATYRRVGRAKIKDRKWFDGCGAGERFCII